MSKENKKSFKSTSFVLDKHRMLECPKCLNQVSYFV